MNEEELKKLMEKKKQEEILKQQLLSFLEPPAYQRLMNVKVANEEFFKKVSMYVMQLGSQIRRKLTEQELISIMKKLKGPERETHIEFKRK